MAEVKRGFNVLTKGKKKAAIIVSSVALATMIMSASAFAYTDAAKALIQTGVGKVVAAVIPSVGGQITQHENDLKTALQGEIQTIANNVYNTLTAYGQQEVDRAKAAQNDYYTQTVNQAHADAAYYTEQGKGQITDATNTAINAANADLDAALEAGLNAIVNP